MVQLEYLILQMEHWLITYKVDSLTQSLSINYLFTHLLIGGSNVALPTTAIRFRPLNPSIRTKNVFIAANAAGAVQHWHMTSGKCLHSLLGSL
jgi:hypothetical protein